MSSSSRSAGTNLIGLLRNNNNSFEDDLQSESPERRAPRRSSLDSLHALAEFLPDDLLCDQQGDNVAATTFGSSSDPLMDMPMMTIDIDNPSNYNTSPTEDEYFESTLSEPTNFMYASTNHPSSSHAQKDKPKRRASTDAFVNFHRMMKTSASANAFDIMPTPGMSFATPSTRHDSMSSFTTACESISSNAGTNSNPNHLNIPKSFAESMLKSSQSREQLDYMQRQVLLQQQQGGSIAVPSTPSVAATSTRRSSSISTLASPTTPQKRRQLNPETVTLTAQFLSGKRPTLTSALEESRKKLKAYQDKLGCGTY